MGKLVLLVDNYRPLLDATAEGINQHVTECDVLKARSIEEGMDGFRKYCARLFAVVLDHDMNGVSTPLFRLILETRRAFAESRVVSWTANDWEFIRQEYALDGLPPPPHYVQKGNADSFRSLCRVLKSFDGNGQ